MLRDPNDDAIGSPSPEGRLDSWKEVAEYLGKGVSTVRRWEREEGLPVHRQQHAQRGSIVAYKAELATWLASRTKASEDRPERTADWKRMRLWLVLASVAALLAFVLLSRPGGGGSAWSQPSRMISVTSGPIKEGPPHLSPDGTRVAYVAEDSSGAGLYIKPVEGGQARRVAGVQELKQHPKWSPDGTRILIEQYGGGKQQLVVHSMEGVAAETVYTRSFVSPLKFQWADWMPGGRELLVVDKDEESQPWSVYLVNLAEKQRRRISFPAQGTIADEMPAASPDGSRVAIARHLGGSEGDIYLVDLQGGKEVRLTFDRTYIDGIEWDPDGKSIVYGSNRSGAVWQLWHLRVDGSQPPQLINGPGHDASYPTIATRANGKRLTYLWTNRTVNLVHWERPEQEGSQPRPLAPSSYFDGAAQFSPDGDRVVFASTRGGRREIWVVNADGTGLRPLTDRIGKYTDSPRWSPDGRHVVFTASIGEDRDVFIVPASGGAARRIPRAPSEEGRASWSRDGKWIYCRSNFGGREEIWRLAADGSAQATQMTTGGGYEAFESLDSRWLYFTKNRENRGLWRVPAGGGKEEFVAGRVREGLWSVGAKAIYYVDSSPEFAIWILPVESGGQARKLAALPNQAGGAWTGFTGRADGSAFLFSQTVQWGADIVALDYESR